MPVHEGHDENGAYYVYGEHGKRYYFDPDDLESQNEAHQRAVQQGRAIHASQHRR